MNERLLFELPEMLKLESRLAENVRGLLKDRLCSIERLASDFQSLYAQDDLTRLAAVLYMAVQAHEEYDRRGISEKIYLDTMSDIRIWCENNENRGLRNIGWLRNPVFLQIFRLGRLQFQLFTCEDEALDYGRLPFSKGEQVIYVHVPQGEPLDTQACRSSFYEAEAFFREYFPAFCYDWYFCESWLLYEGNKEFMREGCNILRFAKLFSAAYSEEDDRQAIERIFGAKSADISLYSEETSLQRRAKAYLLSGKRLGTGIGVIKKDIWQQRSDSI